MRILNIAIVASVLSVIAAPAFAGTSVTNSTTIRNTHAGKGVTNTTLSRHTSGTQVNTSQSLKSETYGGTTNISNVNFDGTNLTGSAHSSNEVIVDPVAIITYSSQVETLHIVETLQVDAVESYKFNETTNSHTVSSDSF